MTGTAKTEELEFEKIYNLKVVPIQPTKQSYEKIFRMLFIKINILNGKRLLSMFKHL